MAAQQKAVIITGGNTGLGFECARAIAKQNSTSQLICWTVVIACRNIATGQEAAAKLRNEFSRTTFHAIELNLASLSSIRGFSQRLDAISQPPLPPIGSLICNAGIQIVSARQETADGFEITFGTNHLGHFLLVYLLLPRLDQGARIIVVSSGTHDPKQRTGMPDPKYAHPREIASHVPAPHESANYFGRVAYTTSKLCNTLFALELARRCREDIAPARRDISVNAFDPGLMNTGLARDWPWPLRLLFSAVFPLIRLVVRNTHSVDESASALAWLAVDPEGPKVSGRYFEGRREIPPSDEAQDEVKQRELWEGSEELVGILK